MFILLKEIVDLSTAQCISLTQISCMRHTIFEYLEMRVKLFPEVILRPKHHYLTHYPYLIKQFGPLIRFWTMRFESKHSYFKNVIRHTRNFKNVSKTCTERHQYLQSLLSTHVSRVHITTILQYKNDAKTSFNSEEKQLFLGNKINFVNYFLCEKVEYRGVEFKSLDIIYHKRGDYGEPIFAKIIHIFVEKISSEVFFLFLEQKVIDEKSFGIIQLDITDSKYFLLKASAFLDLTIHYKYSHNNGTKYICIKYAIPY